MTTLQIADCAVLAVIGLYGAWLDIRFRRLPNWLCLAALAAGLGFSLVAGGWAAGGWALLHAVVALAIGAGMFALGGIGGGDAKFYAGMAAWFPLQAGLGLLVSVSLTGLILLVVWMAIRGRLLRARPNLPKDSEFRKLPYGVAIAGGALINFVLLHFAT